MTDSTIDSAWRTFLFTFPAYYWIDTRGRRYLLLASYPGMIAAMLMACLTFALAPESADLLRRWLVSLAMYIFILCYSIGQGPGLYNSAFEGKSAHYVQWLSHMHPKYFHYSIVKLA